MHRYEVQYLEWSCAGVSTALPAAGRGGVAVVVARARRRNQKTRENQEEEATTTEKKYKRALNELNE